MSRNEELWERSQRVTPGGVNSPVRAFRSVGGAPYFVKRGEGAFVWDVDDTAYLDFVQSYGASILGHANPLIIQAIRKAAVNGTTFGAPTEREVLLAEAICARVHGCDQIRLVSSGTEATMSAIRLARGATGRDRVVMFEGNYHGHSDMLLASGGSGVATLGLPASAGVPKGAVADSVVVAYNQVPQLDERVAAVIVEPVAANMGLVPPVEGFLQGLRDECDRVGAILIFDEVITGFRVAQGGASAWSRVTPDLWTFGKVIGGGLPLAAFGGRREIMEHLAPGGEVYQAGTLSGNPLATAAGLAALAQLDDAAFRTLTSRVEKLAQGIREAFAPTSVEVQVPTAGSLIGLFFAPRPVTDKRGADSSASTGLYPRLMHALLKRNVALAPGAYEILFCSLAHGDEEMDTAIEAFREVAATL